MGTKTVPLSVSSSLLTGRKPRSPLSAPLAAEFPFDGSLALPVRECQRRGQRQRGLQEVCRDAARPAYTYGIHTFVCTVARATPAAMAANCAHPARMVLGPGGL